MNGDVNKNTPTPAKMAGFETHVRRLRQKSLITLFVYFNNRFRASRLFFRYI